jgi:hypothetical protein
MFADHVSLLRIFGSTGNPSVQTTKALARRIPQYQTMDANRHYQFDSGRASEPPPMGERNSGPAHSPNIPLPSSHVHRTQSEIQLSIDEAAAEQRDFHMFYRLVNGIRQRHYNQAEYQNRGVERPIPPRRLQVPDFSDNVVDSEGRRDVSQEVLARQEHKGGPTWPLNDLLDTEGVVAMSSLDGGGWSISGYDEPEVSPLGPSLPWTSVGSSPRQENEDDNEDEELFALDL